MTINTRPIDTSRATRMVLATITNDEKMLTLALTEAVQDEYEFALLNSIGSLAAAIGSSAVAAHGQQGAERLLQRTIAVTLRDADAS